MAARRSGLHIRQSPRSLLPCQQLPDRIQEASYHRRMKMSEFWRSCLISCGTSIFGFLRERTRGFGSLKVILHRFSELSRKLFPTHDSEEPGHRSHRPSPTVHNIALRFSRWYARRKYSWQRITVLKGQMG